MESPLAVVLPPTRREHEDHARAAAQVLVEAAFAVRTSWPSRPDSGSARVRCAVLFGRDDAQLTWVRENNQAVPVLVVHNPAEGSATPLGAPEVVLPSRLRLDLPRLAARCLTEDVLRHAEDVLSSHPVMLKHSWIRRATVLAVRERKLGVHILAAKVGCSVRHLENQWAEMRGGSRGDAMLLPRFEDFLHLIFVLHAIRGWLADPFLRTPWSDIALALGVTEETLRNTMRHVLKTLPSAIGMPNVVPFVVGVEWELLSPFE